MEVLTHQFEFSGQGRLLTLLTRRLVRNRIGSQQLRELISRQGLNRNDSNRTVPGAFMEEGARPY